MWNMLLPAVLRMSFTGSIVILVVLLARILMRHMPRIFSYLLWGVVLLRLLCPVSFHTHLSVMKFVDVLEETGEQGSRYGIQDFTHYHNVPLPVSGIKDSSHVQKMADNGEADNVQPGKDNLTETFLYWGTVIWLAGAAAIFIYNIISLVPLRKKLVGAVRLRDNIYFTDYVPSAFVFGVLRPRIYLPSMLSGLEQEYIIMHEQVHIRRKDYLVKVLALIALGIHWFNPFVWLACRLADKDMEMSCDEAVMREIKRDIRAEYSASLLKLATGRRNLSGTFPAFGEGETGDRIKHILRYKKPTIAAILAAAIITGTTVVFAGSEPGKQGSGNLDSSSWSVDALKDDIPDKNISSGGVSAGESPGKSSSAEDVSVGAGENKYANSVSAVVPGPGETWEHVLGVDENYEHTMECAFLRLMTEDTIEADPVEFIDTDTDPKRLEELGITMEYLHCMDGYELNNPDKDTLTWKIDDNTEFIFLDWGLDFIREEEQNPVKSITVKTKDRELFRSYLATYKNSKPGMPFFFEVEDGVVKRIVERFFA